MHLDKMRLIFRPWKKQKTNIYLASLIKSKDTGASKTYAHDDDDDDEKKKKIANLCFFNIQIIDLKDVMQIVQGKFWFYSRKLKTYIFLISWQSATIILKGQAHCISKTQQDSQSQPLLSVHIYLHILTFSILPNWHTV